MRRLLETGEPGGWDSAGFTASSRLAVPGSRDAVLCVVEGARHVEPRCRNVISGGAETHLQEFYRAGGQLGQRKDAPRTGDAVGNPGAV